MSWFQIGTRPFATIIRTRHYLHCHMGILRDIDAIYTHILNKQYQRQVGRSAIRMIIVHYSDVIMGAMASQITGLTVVHSTVYSGVDQRKHQSFASLAFVRGIHRWPVNSPHKGPVTRKMFPFDDVIMYWRVSLPTMIMRCASGSQWCHWGHSKLSEAHFINII